jgi:hypothetical protein
MRKGSLLGREDIANEDFLDIFRLQACTLNGGYVLS